MGLAGLGCGGRTGQGWAARGGGQALIRSRSQQCGNGSRGRPADRGQASGRGSRVAGAPEWLKLLAATMAAKGNDRATAREIFRRLYENTDDAYTREVSALRLLALEALDEVDAINVRLAEAQQRGSCPAPDKVLVEVRRQQPPSPALVAFSGTGFPYAYDRAVCRVALPSDSPLARWLAQ